MSHKKRGGGDENENEDDEKKYENIINLTLFII